MYLKFLPDNSVGYISDKKIEKMFEDVISALKAPLYQPATDTFFYRALNNGSNNIVVMCDANGKLITDTNDNYYKLANNVWSEQSNPSVTLIQNAGGTTLVEVTTDENGKTLILDIYTVVIGLDGILALGNIPIWSKQLTYAAKDVADPNSIMICDSSGQAIRLIQNTAENWGSVFLVYEYQGELFTNDHVNLQGNYDWMIDIPESDHYVEDNYYCFVLDGMTYKIATYDWDVATHGPQFTPVVPIPYHAS